MQNNAFLIFTKVLLLFSCLFPAATCLAQQVTTNNNGEKIVIFDDGSWRYFNPDTDGSLENAKQVNHSGSVPDLLGEKNKKKKNKAEKVKKPKKEKVKKPKKPKKSKGKKNKKEKIKKAKKNKIPKKVKKAKKAKKPKKAKKSKGKKIVKSEVSPETIRQSNAQAVRRADRAAAMASKTQRIYEEVTLDRELMEQELQDAYSNLETTDTDIAEIEGRLQTIRASEVIAEANYIEAEKRSKTYEKMIDLSYFKRKKLLAKMKEDEGGIATTNNNANVVVEANDLAISKAEQKLADEMKARRYEMNVMLNPPTPPCNLVFDGLDEFSGKVRKDVAKELFFTFTNEKMRPYFKNREFISCQAGLTSLSGGLHYLSMDLEVASEKAQRDYGLLEKGAALIVKLIDGSTVRLVNQKTDTGSLNPLQKSVVYKPQYVISASQVKTLSKSEVDRVRVVWSTGYEDYEVYELDFFVNQLRCLEEK